MGRRRADEPRRRAAAGTAARHGRVRADARRPRPPSRARHDLRRRPARRAAERAGGARAGGARGARVAPRRRRAAADRGGLVRARRARAADGRRGGGRRRRRARRRRALRARAERARLRAVCGDEPRPRQLHARGDRGVQPAQRQRVARRGGRACARDRRARRGAGDRHRLVRVGLPVRGRGRSRAPSRISASGSTAPTSSSSPTRSASRRRGACGGSSSASRSSASPVGAHLHNTRNTGYASAWAALDGGATLLDASVGGLGGCPFSPNATGNVATEDLVWQLERDGVATGVDVGALDRHLARGSRSCSAGGSRAVSTARRRGRDRAGVSAP